MLRPPVELMLARAVDRLPGPGSCRGGCRYEPKLDGFRAAMFVTADGVRLQSRNGRPLEGYFPDVEAEAASGVPPGSVLDGELVVWRPDIERTDFAALQQRVVAGRRLPAVAEAAPASYVAFDVLYAGQEDLRALPLRDRRSVLEDVMRDAPDQLPVCPHTDDLAVAETWIAAWESLGIEGLIVKGADTPYTPGRRGGWIKYRIRATALAVVGGVTGSLARPEVLLVGRLDARGRLRYAGRTHPLTTRQATEVAAALTPARGGETPHPWPQPLPPRWAGIWGDAQPVAYVPARPTMVVQLRVDTAYEHGRWRHPARFNAVRADLSPADVPPS